MKKIVICDDDPELCAQLRTNVDRMAAERGESFAVRTFSSAEALLEQWTEDTDILLLDIQMGSLSGMEAARALRRRDDPVCIIFITAMTQYAMEGYEVHAFGFLRKPVGYERFCYVLGEALGAAPVREELTFSLHRGTQIRKVGASEILYIEACGHEIRVVARQGTLLAGATLAEFEQQLSGRGFFRCHKGYLVNFCFVRQIQAKSVTMTNGDEIPLSKHRRKEFLESFAGFAGVRL